jgi:plastocyanin
MKRFAWLSAAVLSVGLCSAASAQITGTVKFDGKAPERKPIAAITADPNCSKLHKNPLLEETIVVDEEGKLANVVVFLKGDNVKGSAPAKEVVLDQKGCVYVPHVVSVTVGQKLIAQNSDTFLHNVHSLSENGPKNIAQVVKAQKDEVPVKAAEIFKVKCDVHPWMAAWVAAFDHPYHAVSDEAGDFKIDAAGLADGSYEIVAWHEKFKESEPQKIAVKGGKADKPVTFTFKQKAAAGNAVPDKEVIVSTTGTEVKSCCAGKCADAAAKVAATPAVAPVATK